MWGTLETLSCDPLITSKTSSLTKVVALLITSARHFLSFLPFARCNTNTRDWAVKHHGKTSSVAGVCFLIVSVFSAGAQAKMNTSAKISLWIFTQAHFRESKRLGVSNSNIACVFTNTSRSHHQGILPPPVAPSKANCCSVSGQTEESSVSWRM